MTVIIMYIGWLSKTTQTKRERKKQFQTTDGSNNVHVLTEFWAFAQIIHVRVCVSASQK